MHAFDNLISIINVCTWEQLWNENYGSVSGSTIISHVLPGVILQPSILQSTFQLCHYRASCPSSLRHFFFFFVCKMEDCLFISCNEEWMIWVKCLGGCVVLPHVTKAQYLRLSLTCPFLVSLCQSFANPIFYLNSVYCSCPFLSSSFYSRHHNLPGLW